MRIPKFQNSKISVGFIIFFATLFMFFSAPWLYGQYSAQVQSIYIIYLIAAIGTAVFLGVRPTTMKQSPRAISGFILFFVITLPMALLFSALVNIQGSVEILSMALAFGFLHAFVKAYLEEFIFRDALMKFMGFIGQGIFFGVFHFAVLMMTASIFVAAGTLATAAVPMFVLTNTAVLTLLGFLWGYVYLRYGMMASTGSHFAWNAVAYGAITMPVLMGGVG